MNRFAEPLSLGIAVGLPQSADRLKGKSVSAHGR